MPAGVLPRRNWKTGSLGRPAHHRCSLGLEGANNVSGVVETLSSLITLEEGRSLFMKRRMWRQRLIQAVALASLLSSGLVASSAGAAVGAPSAPRAVHASGTATSISVK